MPGAKRAAHVGSGQLPAFAARAVEASGFSQARLDGIGDLDKLSPDELPSVVLLGAEDARGAMRDHARLRGSATAGAVPVAFFGGSVRWALLGLYFQMRVLGEPWWRLSARASEGDNRALLVAAGESRPAVRGRGPTMLIVALVIACCCAMASLAMGAGSDAGGRWSSRFVDALGLVAQGAVMFAVLPAGLLRGGSCRSFPRWARAGGAICLAAYLVQWGLLFLGPV